MSLVGDSSEEVEEKNVGVLADEVGDQGGEDDAGNGPQDSFESRLVVPETGGGENLGHVDQEDHEGAEEQSHPYEPGGGPASVEFGDGIGDEEGEGVGEDAGGDGPAVDVEGLNGEDVGDDYQGCEYH